MEYLAFDLEIADDLPEEGRWQDHAPLGITCAATYDHEGKSDLFFGPVQSGGRHRDRMSKVECLSLMWFLVDATKRGVPIVGWNSLGFDLQVLAYETGAWGQIRDLARYEHVDPAFQMLCEKGYMVGLDTACQGMGVEGKLEEVGGARAPEMWRDSREDQEKVLEYVQQDARITGLLYAAIVEKGRLDWITRSGNHSTWQPRTAFGGGKRLLTVGACLKLPEPDTSWMTSARPRSDFAGWLEMPEVQ